MVGFDRFEHVFVRARLDRFIDELLGSDSRRKNDRSIAGQAADLAAEIDAGTVGQPVVQNVEVVLFVFDEWDGVFDTAGKDHLVLAKDERQDLAGILIIFDAEDATARVLIFLCFQYGERANIFRMVCT